MKRRMKSASLSEENAALRALLAQTQTALAAHQAALAVSEEARRRLESILGDLRRAQFGSKSEKLSADQYNLALEDVEIVQGVLDAAHEKAEAIVRGKPAGEPCDRTRNRGRLPAHLPRVERVVEPASRMCPCACGEMARIGESLPSGLTRGTSPNGST